MSSNTSTFTPTPTPASKSTRGTYMSVNGRNIYIESCTLEDCLINFQPDELSPKMRERLVEVFSPPGGTTTTTGDATQTYISVAFDYYAETAYNKEKYILSGFWNPTTSSYEFEWIDYIRIRIRIIYFVGCGAQVLYKSNLATENFEPNSLYCRIE